MLAWSRKSRTKTFYYNRITGVSTYERPRELGLKDPTTGRTYYGREDPATGKVTTGWVSLVSSVGQ